MPSHPERVRTASLPAGYQFGDAEWYDLGAIPYNPFGPMGINYAEPIGNTVRVRIPKRWSVRDMSGERGVGLSAADRQVPVLVEKCTKHGRERDSDCAECRSLPRLEHTYGVRPGDVTAAGAGQTGETLTTSGWSADRDLGDER